MAEPHESRIYSDFARFYDAVFVRAFLVHEHEVVESLNLRPGQRVLEVGVGTGMSLDAFPPYVQLSESIRRRRCSRMRTKKSARTDGVISK